MENFYHDLWKNSDPRFRKTESCADLFDRLYNLSQAYISGDINNLYIAWQDVIEKVQVIDGDYDDEVEKAVQKETDNCNEQLDSQAREMREMEQHHSDLMAAMREERDNAETRAEDLGGKLEEYQRVCRLYTESTHYGAVHLKTILENEGLSL